MGTEAQVEPQRALSRQCHRGWFHRYYLAEGAAGASLPSQPKLQSRRCSRPAGIESGRARPDRAARRNAAAPDLHRPASNAPAMQKAGPITGRRMVQASGKDSITLSTLRSFVASSRLPASISESNTTRSTFLADRKNAATVPAGSDVFGLTI